jgi:hypothetical protein
VRRFFRMICFEIVGRFVLGKIDILLPSLLKTQIFPPKEISFTNALRLVALFCLIKRDEYSTSGLRAEIEKLKSKIIKHIIPKHKISRHYTRKTKNGKYQKYH